MVLQTMLMASLYCWKGLRHAEVLLIIPLSVVCLMEICFP